MCEGSVFAVEGLKEEFVCVDCDLRDGDAAGELVFRDESDVEVGQLWVVFADLPFHAIPFEILNTDVAFFFFHSFCFFDLFQFFLLFCIDECSKNFAWCGIC